jgi:hypothetical protein
MGGSNLRKSQGFLCRAAVFLAVAVPTVTALAGCGGGGGGPTVVYKGTEDPAPITTTDADTLTASVVTAQEFNFPALASFTKVGGPAAGYLPGGFDPAALHRALGALAKAGDGARMSVKVNQDCPGGGSLTLEAPSSQATTGTFKETFFQCDLGDGFVINGSVTDDVSVSTSTHDVGRVRMNLGMTLSGAGFLFLADADYDMDSAALQDHTTGDFEYWDVAGDTGMRIQNMDATQTYANVTDWGDDCALTEDYTMTVSDAVFGMVDMATTTPVTYSVNKCTNPGPVSGGPIVLTGEGGGTITLTPLSTTQATVEVDVDGDATPELSATMLWTDLGFN